MDGFEGVAATLLEQLLGERFVLARSGDQSGVDARNVAGSSVLQAKRYSVTSLTDAQVETDFHRSRRELANLDVYVLAVTKSTAQLRTRLDQLRDETGIDLIVLDWGSDIPVLGALCVTYWPHISQFAGLRDLGPGFAGWASEQAARPEVQRRVQQLRRDIADQLASFSMVQRCARDFLERRFGFAEPPLPCDKIQLQTAVHRSAADSLWQWWQSPSHFIARLQGEEGVGKSWAAAEFAWHAANEAEAIVCWLESGDWQKCRTVEDILNIALWQFGVRDEQVKRRLVHKTRRRWSQRLILVLDGVNENNALPAAQDLIFDLLSDSASRCRLLFTCRHLDHQRMYTPSRWESVLTVEAGSFNDAESGEALKRLTPPLEISQVPQGLKDISRIPRYFETCMRLRERLGGLEGVTREVVFWADLIERIERRGDAQARQRLGWTMEQDAAEVLKSLARKVTFGAGQATAEFELLNRCFQGRYEDVRRDLEELRIAESTLPQSARLSMDHVVLGCALYLQELICSLPGTVSDLAEEIALALEPLASTDARTESLFVALQLTALRKLPGGQGLVRARAALLLRWVSSRNHRDVTPRLEFWARTDTEAYAEFVETYFESQDPLPALLDVVEPLASEWKAGGERGAMLRPRLNRWLLLVWPAKNRPTGEDLEHRGHRLPLARTEKQVGLASIAVSLASLRPEAEMLPALALCWATSGLSARAVFFPRQDAPEQTEEFDAPIKDLYHPIGMVMRWCYTEAVLPELEDLARQHAADGLMLEGIHFLARRLRLVVLPEALQAPEPAQPLPNRGVPPAQLIRERRTLFPAKPEDGFPSESHFGYLAARGDLPDLLDLDRNVIRTTVEDICSRTLPHHQRAMTMEDSRFDRWWPWYAKYFPREVGRLVGKLRMATMATDQPLFTLMELRWGLRDAGQISARELREQIQATAMRYQLDEGRTPHWVLLQLWPLALLELSEDEDELLAWIEFAATQRPTRWAVMFHPTCLLFPLLLSPRIADLAFERCVALADEPAETPGMSATQFDYWCTIAAKAVPASAERYEWVKRQVRMRDPQDHRRFNWLTLLFATAPTEQFALDFAVLKEFPGAFSLAIRTPGARLIAGAGRVRYA
jgi:hypothetical protein